MINYAMLENLEKNCLNLMNSTCTMMDNNGYDLKSVNNEILKSLRKIIIANEMMNKKIICISGLQGAGKTTLIKNMYNLDEGFLNISLGRGEKIPVFINEKKNCIEPCMFGVYMGINNGNYFRDKIKLSQEEFIEASKGNEIDNKQYMYLEIELPFRHIENEYTSLMLLPGFEDKKDYWRNLIEFAVNSSDASIFVFNQSSSAYIENSSKMQQTKELFGNNVIYAISHSDLSKDNNNEVKLTCIKNLDIPEIESDRVVCIGEFKDDKINEKWITQLKLALDRYCDLDHNAERKNEDYIVNVIQDEIFPCLETIKESLEQNNDDISYYFAKEEMFEDYIVIQKKMRKQLLKIMNNHINSASEDSKKKLERLFIDKKYAKEMNLKGSSTINKSLFGPNIKDLINTRERVKESLINDEDGEIFYQTKFLNALEEIKNILPEEIKEKNFLNYSPTTEIEEQKQKITNTMSNSLLLLQGKNIEDTSNVGIQFKNDSKNETIKVISALATYQFVDLTYRKIQHNINASEEGLNNLFKVELIDFDNYKMNETKKTIFSMLGFAGIDLLGDGVLNTIPTIAETLGLSVPVVGVATAVVGATATSKAFITDINKIQIEEFKYASKALDSIEQNIISNYIENYDSYMEEVRIRIESNLGELIGLNKNQFNKLNAKIALNQIDDNLIRIIKEINKKNYELTRTFR